MGPHVIKYPRTEHLVDTGGTAATDDDLIVADLAGMCQALSADPTKPIVVEEKIDGANLGFRIIDGVIMAQNRSHYISSGDHAQFSMIAPWIEEHRQALAELLGSENLILYGEWCAARHSMPYRKLPGSYFVAFDLFDIEQQAFYSRPRFHHALRATGIPVVPTVGVLPAFYGDSKPAYHKLKGKKARQSSGSSSKKGEYPPLVKLVLDLLEAESRFRQDGGTLEGVVLRQDDRDWMLRRYKIVRPDFTRGCQEGHWLRRAIEKNVVDYGFGERYLEDCYTFAGEWQGHEEVVHAKRNDGDQPKKAATKQSTKRHIPRCIILLGLPGAGKSFFAQALAASSTSGSMKTVVANQDNLGRKESLRLAGQASAKCRVIVDRCNLTQAERREFLAAMHAPSRNDTALVHFAAPADVCSRRVKRRIGHATIRPGAASAAVVEANALRLELPTEDELKLFGHVFTVHSWEDANKLLHRWGCV